MLRLVIISIFHLQATESQQSLSSQCAYYPSYIIRDISHFQYYLGQIGWIVCTLGRRVSLFRASDLGLRGGGLLANHRPLSGAGGRVWAVSASERASAGRQSVQECDRDRPLNPGLHFLKHTHGGKGGVCARGKWTAAGKRRPNKLYFNQR